MTSSPAPASFRPSVVIVGLLLFAIISCAIAFVMGELAFRIYLENRYPANFQQPPTSSTFLFFRDSAWTYDREVGYRYKPDHVWMGGFVQNGRLLGCDSSNRTDARGNMGSSGVGYEDAEIKVMVFGDSVTAQPANNVTYPLLLERALSERLGRRVSVLNFGRDGYGVLQMVDLAVREVPRWKPDLVLIDFITDDIDRDRFWRTEMTVDGRARVFTTTIPNPTPPPSQRVDTMLLAPESSQEWCDRLRPQEHQSADPILAGLINHYQSTANSGSVKPTLWDLDYSMVAEAVLRGDPFAFVWRRIPRSTNPRIQRDRYDDAQFGAGIKALDGLDVPVHYVHLPIYPEVKSGSYAPTMHKAALLADLEQLLGRPVLKNLSYMRVAAEEIDRFPVGQYDHAHPSPFGMQAYATSLTEMLARSGALDKWTGPAAASTSRPR
jgi:GDSL-like Lipase/Acylhydrolase family